MKNKKQNKIRGEATNVGATTFAVIKTYYNKNFNSDNSPIETPGQNKIEMHRTENPWPQQAHNPNEL